MKKTLKYSLLLILIGFMSTACSKVPSGNVGIKVYLLGKDKGVDSEVLSTGRYWIGINEELYLFPTFKQNYVWTKSSTEGSENDESFTFQTSEGMNVGADVGITYRLQEDMIHQIFQQYRRGIDEITDVYVRNHVRDALNEIASKLPVESVYGKGKAEFISSVETRVREELSPDGILVDELYLAGSLRLPSQVTQALNAKVEATQRAQQRERELREAEAEAKKKIAKAEGEAQSLLVTARAEAEANELRQRSLTKELLMQQWIQKWDGKLSNVSSGEMPLMLNMK